MNDNNFYCFSPFTIHQPHLLSLRNVCQRFRHERISHVHRIVRYRILSSQGQPHHGEEDGIFLPSSSPSLIFSRPREIRKSYYHCSFLDQGRLVLCSHKHGIDVIALPDSANNLNEEERTIAGNRGFCLARLDQQKDPPNCQQRLYPYQNTTGLFGGTAFVTGAPNGRYDIYDTERQTRQSPSSVQGTRPFSPISSAFLTVQTPKRCETRLVSQVYQHVSCPSFKGAPTSCASAIAHCNHPSWDFLERSPSSVLALHVGADRDYFCVHDSRCRAHLETNTNGRSLSQHMVFLCQNHGNRSSSNHIRLELACFVNEHSVATTSCIHSQDKKRHMYKIHLWDIRYSRRPFHEVSSLNTLFEAGARVQRADPVAQVPVPTMALKRDKTSVPGPSVFHLKALDEKGRLHVATTTTNHQQRIAHWMVDLATGETRRVTTQPMPPFGFTGGSSRSFPFALNTHQSTLACASFHEDRHTFVNKVNISMYSASIKGVLKSNWSGASLDEKRKYDAFQSSESSGNSHTHQEGLLGSFTPQIMDDYGLATPMTHLTWNVQGTRLVGLSSNSDLHLWGGS